MTFPHCRDCLHWTLLKDGGQYSQGTGFGECEMARLRYSLALPVIYDGYDAARLLTHAMFGCPMWEAKVASPVDD